MHEGSDRQRSAAPAEPGPSSALSALLADLARSPGDDAHAWNETLRPGIVVGRFELVRELGRGGFGVVYEARDRELGRAVAFKAVRAGHRPDLREERLLREAEAAARLSHPNIVTLYDAGRSEHGPYLVLELLRGETLAKRLEQGPVSVREALRIGVEVAKGIAHAHGEGVVHRDLTPGNVFLCEDGQVKVLDLGLAHAFGRRRVDGGTGSFMAPEQRRGAPEDERTDVFALGVILFRILAGELPQDGGARGRRRGALDVPELPALGAFVDRMLAPDPVDRPRDGAEVLAALGAFRHELPPPVEDRRGGVRATRAGRERALPGEALGPRERRLLSVALFGVGTLAAIAVAGALVVWGSGRATRTTPAVAAAPSIAVLPFADLSPGRDQEYFSDGIAEEILATLTTVEGLRVIGRTSSFAFKGRSDDLRTIGQKLGVDAVLEGSVRKDGSRARITAQVVNVETGFATWSQTYDRELTHTLAVQAEIARAVVAALKVKLVPDRLRVGKSAAIPEAYDRYLVGQQLLRHGAAESVSASVAAFEKAIALDPAYAPAWAGLAYALSWVGDRREPLDERQEFERRAFAAAEKALALDAELAEGFSARAYLRSVVAHDWDGAQEDFDRALALAGGDADTLNRYASFLLVPLGRDEEALTALRKAVQMDPLAPQVWANLGWAELARGSYARAREALVRALEISPDNWIAAGLLSTVLLLEGRPAEALASSQRIAVEPFRLMNAAAAQHALGRARESQEALDALIAGHARSAAYQIASVHAFRGERERAFEWLERAYAQRDGGMAWLKSDQLLRGLRGDPRFTALLRKLNLPVD
jgi:serine/threonine-protein kinase